MVIQGREEAEMGDQEPYRGPERRRSPRRLVWDVGLVVRAEGIEEQTFTISVNTHGALVLIEAKVEMGQMLVLRNPFTDCEVEARVIRIGSDHGGLALVGVEFLNKPSADFWPFRKVR
jgi:hypothetical protein